MRALRAAGSQALPAGSEPRHLLFDPAGWFVYVLAEMSKDVVVFAGDARRGRLRPVHSVSAYPAAAAPCIGKVSRGAAELGFPRDGRALYASLRGGENVIVAYAVDPKTGTLCETQRLPTGGTSFVSFAVSPCGRWLLFANADSVTVLKMDSMNGRLRDAGPPLARPSRDILFYDLR